MFAAAKRMACPLLRRVTFVKSDKSHQKRPLKPMVSKSYVLRTRMHSTSQKSIACGSYFWGVMDSFARLWLSNDGSAYIANRNAVISGQRQELTYF